MIISYEVYVTLCAKILRGFQERHHMPEKKQNSVTGSIGNGSLYYINLSSRIDRSREVEKGKTSISMVQIKYQFALQTILNNNAVEETTSSLSNTSISHPSLMLLMKGFSDGCYEFKYPLSCNMHKTATGINCSCNTRLRLGASPSLVWLRVQREVHFLIRQLEQYLESGKKISNEV